MLASLNVQCRSSHRQQKARARARRWRAEQRRIREAEAKQEQREKELLQTLRKTIALKVEALARQEALSEQRSPNISVVFVARKICTLLHLKMR